MGVEASCPVSRVCMDAWVDLVHKTADLNNTFATINPVQFERLDIYLLKKYVDDVLTGLEDTTWLPKHSRGTPIKSRRTSSKTPSQNLPQRIFEPGQREQFAKLVDQSDRIQHLILGF